MIIKELSLKNCHAMGVDSLVLSDRPNMVRIFYAHGEHELYRNLPIVSSRESFSVGLHEHHCDIQMIPLFGKVFNIFADSTFWRDGSGPVVPVKLDPFRYTSGINTGDNTSRFQKVETIDSRRFDLYKQKLDKPLNLKANVQHTVFIPQFESAAWMIVEGEENPLYSPITWSNADLENFDSTNLYLPMDDFDISIAMRQISYALHPFIFKRYRIYN